MWTKNGRKLYIASLAAFFCCALSQPVLSSTVWASGTEQEAAVVLSQTQKDQLMKLLNEQQKDLMTLQMELTTLKKQAGTSQEQYQVVEKQLEQAQGQLATLQLDLMTSKKSLTDARTEIEKLQKSLAALNVQIQNLQAENNRLKKSNRVLKISLVLVGGALIGAVASK